MNDHSLWFSTPANEWTDALPLGNGRLGSMVFGGVTRDEFQLNEDTLWSGGPYQPANPGAKDSLDEVRRLIFSGKYKQAEELANAAMMGHPYLLASYQPAGRFFLDFPHRVLFGNYRRSLDLARAVATVTYEVDGVGYRRVSFASAADGVLVIRLSADRARHLSFSAMFASEQPCQGGADATSLRFVGRNRGEHGVEGRLGWAFEARFLVEAGDVAATSSGLAVTAADDVIILIDIATSYRRFDDVSGDPVADATARLDAAAARGYDELLARHIEAHASLYDRFSLDLGHGAAGERPTDERILHFGDGHDPALAALYVHYARYLMICSSRPGTQPANLQGIWNKELRPPWGSKYTTNINLQMNYWLPDPANLAECVEPLITLVEELAVTGAETARQHYGADGWVLHHNTDLWRATTPVDGAQWGVWPTGGAWLCAQLWDHVRFAGRPLDLVGRLYPTIKAASRFFVDYLVPYPGRDVLVTAPSLSPENRHPLDASICAAPTMDNQVLRDLFDATLEAGRLVGDDDGLLQDIAACRNRLPVDRVGAAGQLQEWMDDWDMAAPEIHHRHVSHLYGVYPSLQIDLKSTPELAAAARRSLEIRGDDATGWGIGWRINLWARLGDGNHAHAVLCRLIHPSRSYGNLFDAHPPFQIDGNFGGAAGILEMLVQSTEDRIELLPALPDAWPTGAIKGVRVRGGVSLDFSWADGRIVSLTATSAGEYKGRLACKDMVFADGLPAGRSDLVLPSGSPAGPMCASRGRPSVR